MTEEGGENMETAVHSREIRKDNPTLRRILRIIVWIVLIALAVFTLIPFVWMISSSLKLDRECSLSRCAGSRRPSTGKTIP